MRVNFNTGDDRIFSRVGRQIIETIRLEMAAEGERIEADIRNNIDAGAPAGESSSGHLTRRSGSLYRSVKSKVVGTTLEIGAGAKNSYKYAEIHETGKPSVIRPVRSDWLTIPTKLALGPDGLVSSTAKKYTSNPATSPLVKMVKKGSDKGFLVKTKGAKQGVWFLLRKRVPYVGSYPKRPYMRPAVMSGARRLSETLGMKFHVSSNLR